MGCRLTDFKVGAWKQTTVRGHRVECAPAKYCDGRDAGVVYKLDGVFQGSTGTPTAALYHVERALGITGPQQLIREVLAAIDARIEKEYAWTTL